MRSSTARLARLLPLGLTLLPACFGAGSRSFLFQGTGLEEKAEREETFALPLKEGERLAFEEIGGNVEVVADAAAEPTLRVRLVAHGSTQEEAQRILERYRARVEPQRGGLVVRYEGDPYVIEEGNVTWTIGASAHFSATVPPGIRVRARTTSGKVAVRGPLADCDLETKFGEVEATDVEGNLLARTSSGPMRIARARGGEVQVVSEFGNLTLEDVRAETVRAESRSGRVALEDVAAESIRVRSGFGELDLSRVSGDVEARTSSGAVTVAEAGEGRLVLRTDFGTVKVRDASGQLEAESRSGAVTVTDFAGDASVKSGFGSLALEGVFRKLDARTTSGSVTGKIAAGSAPASAWHLSSGFGNVTLEVPATFDCRLEAETSFGEVESDFHLGSRDDRKTLTGDVNAGGEVVRLETKSGSIRVRKVAP